MTALLLDRLTVNYGATRAIGDFTLAIDDAELVALGIAQIFRSSNRNDFTVLMDTPPLSRFRSNRRAFNFMLPALDSMP